jgi:hypothetical protein
MAIFPGSAIPSADDYTIDQSLRSESGTAYLTRTPGSAGDTKTWTMSWWVKGVTGNMWGAGSSGNPRGQMRLDASTGNAIWSVGGLGTHNSFTTTAAYRDPSSWYHFVLAYDSTQSVEANRTKFYVNGSQVTDFSETSYPSLNQSDNPVMDDVAQYIVSDYGLSTSGGYWAEFHGIDGQALTPSSFGETDSTTNQWKPIEYTGTYGTNGFYLKFQDSASLGDDSSGNTNDFTATNLVATDQMTGESPTNNFCTLNALNKSSMTLSEGNLKGLGTT